MSYVKIPYATYDKTCTYIEIDIEIDVEIDVEI